MQSNTARKDVSQVVEVEDWQIESGNSVNGGMVFKTNDAVRPYFSTSCIADPNSSVYGLISRTALKHGVRKGDIYRWLSDLGVAASSIIFAAGPSINTDADIHLVSISNSEEMMGAVRAGIANKPPGVWLHYTTIFGTENGFFSKSALRTPLWLYGILASEHVFYSRDAESELLIRNLRSSSKSMLASASEDVVSELEIFDAYRKITGEMPLESNFALLFLRAKLEDKGVKANELLAESEIASKHRGICTMYAARGLLKIAKSMNVGKEDIAKYSSIIHEEIVKRGKRITPPPLPLSFLARAARPNHI